MKQGHYFEHIIYNENFLVIMEEFKSLILNDDGLSNYCSNDRLRFSAAIRWLVVTYVNNKFHDKYFRLILVPYREKIIIKGLRNASEFKNYEADDKMVIERKIREIFSLLDIERAVNNIKELIRKEIEVVPVQKIMEVIDNSKK